MADTYYSLQETIDKLGKSEEEIRELIKDGKLQEFRDGADSVFKTEEVDALVSAAEGLDITGEGSEVEMDITGGGSEVELAADETAGVSLEPDEEEELAVGDVDTDKDSEGGFDLTGLSDITGADTAVGTTGISVLGETDDDYKLTDDTHSETRGSESAEMEDLGDLDDDMNLDSVGSGSGLLDLSLQADDTSLGAVLDDILPAGAEDEVPIGGDDVGIGAEADEIFEQSGAMPVMTDVPAAPAAAPAAMAAYIELEADTSSNACGMALFVPLLAMIYAAIVVTAAVRDVVPGSLKSLQGSVMGETAMIWLVAAALAVVVIVIFAVGALAGGRKSKKKKVDVYEQPAGGR